MAAEGRGPDPDLDDAGLFDEPYRFDFFQAVRLLIGLDPGRRSVGRGASPGDEAVRFVARPHLGFPASAIHDLERGGPDGPPTMTVGFLGLTGPSGVLPTFYSEMVAEEAPGGPLGAFLNLFDHRLISLFFRAWERNHPLLAADPEARARFSGYLLSIAGLSLAPTRGPHPVRSEALLAYCGLFAQARRSAAGLSRLIRETLNHPDGPLAGAGGSIVDEVVPFVGRWLDFGPDLAVRLTSGPSSAKLGDGAILGRRARDYRGKFRVRLGPLTLDQFRLLQPVPPGEPTPPGPRSRVFDELVRLVRLYVGPEFTFDVELTLRAVDVAPARPGRGDHPPRLGRTWLVARRSDRDLSVIVAAI